jgi:integrase
MASVIKDPNGFKRVQWCVGDGQRRTLRLGAVSVRQAEAVRVRIEQVLASKSTGVMDCEATKWLESLDDDMHGKMAKLGLVAPRGRQHRTLSDLLTAYFDNLAVKSGTKRVYEQARTGLEAHFGAATALSAITPLSCDQWRQAMVKAELAPPTIAKRVKTARQIFKQAVRWKMMTENPFADVKAGGSTNKSRMFFVTREDVQKVLEACPDAEWRLIVALSRFGGVRVPSEIMPLTWSDVDFEKGLIHVRSCKTEAYEGKDRRVIPMFPQLRTALMEVFEQAEDGTEHLIARHRLRCGNLRTRMLGIIQKAGLTAWPKPFHNMRSSRQTELCEQHPIHVVCAWLGNSPAVAMGHYLQVRDSDYAKAIQTETVPAVGAASPATGPTGDGSGGQEAGPGPRRHVGDRDGAVVVNVAA